MKITDVTLTLFGWDHIPPTSYAVHTGKFVGSSTLGLLAITTDHGITGNAFLGSAYYGADLDGQGLLKYLKPILMDQNPLDRERLYQALWSRTRTTT
ncbi:MAG: mandelate racemase, partial [Burkholderiales bacterium]